MPVVGFTWYRSPTKSTGASRLRGLGNVSPVGLSDLDRDPRTVGLAYAHLIRLFEAEMERDSLSRDRSSQRWTSSTTREAAMLTMLHAHGLDAGRAQRPLLADSAAGLVAAVPALAVMLWFGSLNAPISAAGTPPLMAVVTCCGFLLLGGLLYGQLFQRAANDVRGGWLFGLAFEFILWMLGPIPLLQWLPDQPILRGYPAAGLLLARLPLGAVAQPHTQ